MADINLSLATRTTLLQSQRARALIDATAQRPSTGVRVNAITDAAAFFDARSRTDRAGDLLGIKDDISEAASTVGAAVAAIDTVVAKLDTALTTLRTIQSTLGGNDTLLDTRLTFTGNLINTLEGGAATLIDADLNAEAANRLALQTRHDLAPGALSLSFNNGSAISALLQLA